MSYLYSFVDKHNFDYNGIINILRCVDIVSDKLKLDQQHVINILDNYLRDELL